MKKPIIIIIFVLLYALVTFFGLGPVLFADGSIQERILTFAIVVGIYVVLTLILRRLMRS